MSEHKINDNVTLIYDESGRFEPENMEVRAGKELYDWKNAPKESLMEIVESGIIDDLKEKYENTNDGIEHDENGVAWDEDGDKIEEPERVEAELVEEPVTKMETLRSKAHAKPTPPTRPSRAIKVRLSRTIKGLSPSLMECGKIKIGGKGAVKTSRNGNQFRAPEKYNHFVVTTMNKNSNDDFEPDQAIMSILGTEPSEIPVRLIHEDISLNFPTSYAYYDSARCQCRGDGELAITAEGEYKECNPDTCKRFQEKKCKPNGVLSVILDDAPRVGGVYKFRTTSWNSINNLIASMEIIKRLTNGILAGLPLMLTLTPKQTVIPGSTMKTTIYMVNLEYRGSLKDMANARRETLETRKMMNYSIEDFERMALAELDAPEDPEEAKDIQEEFYPE